MNPLPRSLVAAFAVVFALLVLIAALGGPETPRPGEPIEPQELGAALADPVPYDGRSPREPSGRLQRVLVALPRPALGARPDLERLDAEGRRTYVGSLRDESRALRSALEARGVRLRQVVTYELTWNGFAATVPTRDLSRLGSLGVRTRDVRRFYPAVSESVPVPGAPDADLPAPVAGRPVVALLAGGLPPLPFVAAGGYDAVGRDGDPAPEPDPRDRQRTEAGGLAPAGVLGAAGLRVRPIRVSGVRSAADGTVSEHGTTDELLAGLERTVDPDGDGDVSDRARIAVIAVNAPYAGFAAAPEAEAVEAARRLGTRVVAPAGHEGLAEGAYGTIGSPGGTPAAITVGAASEPDAVPRSAVDIEGLRVPETAVLAGTPERRRLRTAPAVEADTPEELTREGAPSLAGRLAVVRAGDNPGAQAAAAAAAGAAAVLLADERDDVPLPTLPAGRVAVPVLGVTGEAARAVIAAGPNRVAAFAPPRLEADLEPGVPAGDEESRFSSRGPAFGGHPAPDVWAPGSVLVARRLVSGGAVAAAGVAARLAAGEEIEAPEGDVPDPVAVPVGDLRPAAGAETGVRFALGRFERGLPTRIVPIARLELTLERVEGASGSVARRLTPAGGELGLLPAEYGYTLPAAAVRRLEPGPYRFRVRAWAPRQRRPTVRTSPTFAVP